MRKLSHTLTTFGSVGLAIAINVLPLTQPASAETLARAQGRCKLTHPNSTVFDGYCFVKQKQQGSTSIFVVELDDGSTYRFYGPNKQALQVETHTGVHNVRFKEEPDKGVFIWDVEGKQNTLSVKLDTQHPPNVSHDSSERAIGVAIAAGAVGALIGSLLSK
jgi:hypothetical protein